VIVPRRAADQLKSLPIGTGPFKLAGWKRGDSATLARNPYYYIQGIPYLDKVIFKFIPDPSAQLAALRAGDVDVIAYDLSPENVVLLEQDARFKVLKGNTTTEVILAMNHSRKPFNSRRVREAMTLAIDRQAVIQGAVAGYGTPIGSHMDPTNPYYVDLTGLYPYNPEKAKQLLAAAGYPNGFSTTLYSHNVDPMPKIAQSIQNDLAAVGVKASLKLLDRDTYYTLDTTANKTPTGTSEWYMDFPDPSDYVIPLASKSNAVTGGADPAFWWDPQIEKMVVQARSLTGQPRYDAYAKMAQIIMDNAPYVPLFQPLMTTMCSKNVGGFYLNYIYWFDPASYWRVQ